MASWERRGENFKTLWNDGDRACHVRTETSFSKWIVQPDLTNERERRLRYVRYCRCRLEIGIETSKMKDMEKICLVVWRSMSKYSAIWLHLENLGWINYNSICCALGSMWFLSIQLWDFKLLWLLMSLRQNHKLSEESQKRKQNASAIACDSKDGKCWNWWYWLTRGGRDNDQFC